VKLEPLLPGADLLFSARKLSKKLGRAKPTIQELIWLAEYLSRSSHRVPPAGMEVKAVESSETIAKNVVRHIDHIIEGKLENWFQPPSDLAGAPAPAPSSSGPLTKEQKGGILEMVVIGLSIPEIARRLRVDPRRVSGYVRTMINSGKLKITGEELKSRKGRAGIEGLAE